MSSSRPPGPSRPTHHLTLYVRGETRRTRQARRYVRDLVEELDGPVELDVVRVAADAEQPAHTPMLVCRDFDPPRRVIGDLGDTRQLKRFFDQPGVTR